MNKLQWNFNQNTNLFIHEDASEYIVCEMAVISSRGDELNDLCLHGLDNLIWHQAIASVYVLPVEQTGTNVSEI